MVTVRQMRWAALLAMVVCLICSAGAQAHSPTAGVSALRDCNHHTANLTVTSARNMSCGAARSELRGALSRCCTRRFRTPDEGFSCRLVNQAAFQFRCVQGRRAFRFVGSEDA